jgi:hypothetical protein
MFPYTFKSGEIERTFNDSEELDSFIETLISASSIPADLLKMQKVNEYVLVEIDRDAYVSLNRGSTITNFLRTLKNLKLQAIVLPKKLTDWYFLSKEDFDNLDTIIQKIIRKNKENQI